MSNETVCVFYFSGRLRGEGFFFSTASNLAVDDQLGYNNSSVKIELSAIKLLEIFSSYGESRDGDHLFHIGCTIGHYRARVDNAD